MTIGEIQAGIELTRPQDPAKVEELEAWLDKVVAAYGILPMDAAAFREGARLKQRKPDALLEDAMIVAAALVHGLTLATRNTRDFCAFPVDLANPFRAKDSGAGEFTPLEKIRKLFRTENQNLTSAGYSPTVIPPVPRAQSRASPSDLARPSESLLRTAGCNSVLEIFMGKTITAAAFLLLAGSTATLAQGSEIRFVKEVAPTCEHLGSVSQMADNDQLFAMFSAFEVTGGDSVFTESMKAKARAMGANRLVVVDIFHAKTITQGPTVGYHEAVDATEIRARAFYCA